MRRLYGTGDFEHVNYRFLEEPGKRVLAVDAVEKSWGPDYLRLGLGLSSDFSGDAYFNMLASYRRTWLNSLGAEVAYRSADRHARQPLSEFYQPLDVKRGFFVAPRVALGQERVNLFSGGDRIAVYNVGSRDAAVDLGVKLDQYGEIRLGIEGGG